jgi:hypothetical protein
LAPVRDGLILKLPSELGNDEPNLTAQPMLKLPLLATLTERPRTELPDRLFSLFLLCNWRPKLAKCRRADCGRYFELKHWNRTYKRGIRCPECQRKRSQETAVLSTSKSRKQAESELYRQAAKRFGKRIAKQPAWYSDPKVKCEMIDFLNEQIAKSDSLLSVYRRCLTGKWLGWKKNRDGIERAAKGRIHAKG